MPDRNDRSRALGRLSVSPSAGGSAAPGSRGVLPLGLGDRRDGALLVPDGAPSRLVVALHGAGGSGRRMLDLVAEPARRRGLLVLAPDARSTTWDVIVGGYGTDVAFLSDAITHAVSTYGVDPAGALLCGFSDGASYALSLGIGNGDLFERIIAWSPGFMAPATRVGTPRIFVSHGVADRVLPIDRCSRRLVPVLRADGYHVTYEEFDDGHVVPPAVVERSLDWALSPGSPAPRE